MNFSRFWTYLDEFWRQILSNRICPLKSNSGSVRGNEFSSASLYNFLEKFWRLESRGTVSPLKPKIWSYIPQKSFKTIKKRLELPTPIEKINFALTGCVRWCCQSSNMSELNARMESFFHRIKLAADFKHLVAQVETTMALITLFSTWILERMRN